MVGERFASQVLKGIVELGSFSDKSIEWIKAKETTFIECDFSHSQLKSCYFHRARFIRCRFVGAMFVDCNLRGATFDQCDFAYASFRFTPVEVREVLKNAPAWENVRRELAQSLRKNFDGLGDIESMRAAFDAEMEASCEHWRSAFRGRTGYYIEHYRGWRRLRAGWKFGTLIISRVVWGYGESPLRLLLSILVVNFLMSLALDSFPSCANAKLGDQLVAQFSAFLGLDLNAGCEPPPWFLLSQTAIRLVSVGLIGGLLLRRFSRR